MWCLCCLKANSLKTLFVLHITHAHTVEIYTHALSLPLTYIKTITKVHRTSITNIPTVFSIPASNAHNVGLKGFSTNLTPGQIKPRRGRWRGEDVGWMIWRRRGECTGCIIHVTESLAEQPDVTLAFMLEACLYFYPESAGIKHNRGHLLLITF